VTPSDYELHTIEDALRGDHEAGREALDLCASGLATRTLSPALADYLSARIWAYLNGEPLDRALCVELERSPGRPPDPIPDWQTQLAAFDLLLERRGYKAERRNAAMDDARAQTHPKGKGLHRSDASKLRKTHLPMRSLSDEMLLHRAGESLREILKGFAPQ
jgi:hypothetical protein